MGTGQFEGPLNTRTDVSSERIALTLIGSAESEVLEQLRIALDGVHEQAAPHQVKVAVDLRDLEFATSSCLKVFATWLVQVSEMPTGYAVTFISSPKHSWQRRSLGALRACAPDLITVENG